MTATSDPNSMTPSDETPATGREPASQPAAPGVLERSLLLASLLAWTGVAISFLLVLGPDLGGAPFCLRLAGCEAILSSRYSVLAGIPLPWLGIAYYLSALTVLLLACATGSGASLTRLLTVGKWLTFDGAGFSACIMLIEFVVLRGFCPLCTASAIVALALYLLTARSRALSERTSCPGSRRSALALAGFVLISGVTATLSSTACRDRLRDALSLPLRIDLSTARMSGPRDAPVELVVFSDFQCPVCAQLAPVLKKIRDQFPDEVLLAYRYFPIEGHDRALPAAIAAECAARQGKFWEYHDEMFAVPEDLSDDRFLAIADSRGLDREVFEACLASGDARQTVESSFAEAAQNRLPGVPMVFLNGRRLAGPLDFDSLAGEIAKILPPGPPSG